MATFKIEILGNEAEVEVTRQGNLIRVAHNGRSYELLLQGQDGPQFFLQLKEDGGRTRLIRAAGESNGDKRQMWANGRTFSYSRVRQRAGQRALDGSLTSSIPAVVSKLLVNQGDQVNEGDKLILLESMKMVIPIHAPQDGTVKAVHCAEGESVAAGRPLIELE